ncbi:MAG: nucleotidyltransferase domain-containing protein [Nitrospirota bacterium]
MDMITGHITPLENRFITKLVDRIGPIEGVKALILYGSRAGGFSDEDSDLDLALITDRSFPQHKLDNIKDEIMEEMSILGELRVEVFGFAEEDIKHLPIGKEIEGKGILLWKKGLNLQKAL